MLISLAIREREATNVFLISDVRTYSHGKAGPGWLYSRADYSSVVQQLDYRNKSKNFLFKIRFP